MKKEQENMEKLLKSELKKEAEAIRVDVEAEESLQDVSLPEDMEDTLQEKIRLMENVQALEEMLPEKDREALRLGREMQALGEVGESKNKNDNDCEDENNVSSVPVSGGKIVRGRRRLRKAYVLVAAAVIMVMAFGMTSIGGTPFFMEVKKQLIDDREITKVNTEREDEKEKVVSNNDEEKAYREIEDEFGILPVQLGYTPEGTKFLNCDIDREVKTVCMIYQYQESIIEYQILFNYKERSYGYDIEDNIEKEKTIEVSEVPISMKSYILEESEKVYVAQFEYNNVYYIFSAAISEGDFVKIIKNLIFY